MADNPVNHFLTEMMGVLFGGEMNLWLGSGVPAKLVIDLFCKLLLVVSQLIYIEVMLGEIGDERWGNILVEVFLFFEF